MATLVERPLERVVDGIAGLLVSADESDRVVTTPMRTKRTTMTVRRLRIWVRLCRALGEGGRDGLGVRGSCQKLASVIGARHSLMPGPADGDLVGCSLTGRLAIDAA
jgi:hypothetical protein